MLGKAGEGFEKGRRETMLMEVIVEVSRQPVGMQQGVLHGDLSGELEGEWEDRWDVREKGRRLIVLRNVRGVGGVRVDLDTSEEVKRVWIGSMWG